MACLTLWMTAQDSSAQQASAAQQNSLAQQASAAQQSSGRAEARRVEGQSDHQSYDPLVGSSDSPFLTFDSPKTIDMLIGVRIIAGDGSMLETAAQTVFPTQWPEQTVEILQVNSSPGMHVSFRDLPGNNKQLLVHAPLIQPGSSLEATVHVRIIKSQTLGPQETEQLRIPKRPNSKLKPYLGSSPYIDPSLSEIRRIVKQINEKKPESDWQRVELLYDWVQENIAYENGELKTVQQALKDRSGDCEEMTGIFVALCRAARVPARCVWIPNHCYPEFYLEDENGIGHWFPCQAAGTRNFGSMPEHLPILQKGDRFKVPEKTEVQRYLADYLSSKKVTGQQKPRVEFIRQLLGDAALLPTPDQSLQQNISPPSDAQGPESDKP